MELLLYLTEQRRASSRQFNHHIQRLHADMDPSSLSSELLLRHTISFLQWLLQAPSSQKKIYAVLARAHQLIMMFSQWQQEIINKGCSKAFGCSSNFLPRSRERWEKWIRDRSTPRASTVPFCVHPLAPSNPTIICSVLCFSLSHCRFYVWIQQPVYSECLKLL